MKHLCVIVSFAAFSLSASAQTPSGEHWVATWATAPVGRPMPGTAPAITATATTTTPATATATPPATTAPAAGAGRGPAVPPLVPNNQTLREIVHASVNGDALRVVFSNAFGTAPLTIGAASIALRDAGSAIVTSSSHSMTFAGKATTTVPAGAVLISDAVSLPVPAFADLAIDVYLADDMSKMPVTVHNAAYQTNYVVTGNHVGEREFADAATTASWFYVSRVEVRTTGRTATIVALGDSITDGTGSTVGANLRWPDHLARRLAAAGGGVRTSVVNAGIGGNRLLADGAGVNVLARLDRDALAPAGATHLVLLEGINDIGLARENATPSAADLIAAHRQVIERAHARGLKVIGATLTPFEGAAYYTAAGEAKRAAVNEWIRTGKAYDGVIDFDAAVRDPEHPLRFLPQYDRGDHLHPSDAGYEAMGKAIDLTLFALR
jgi:lysophospholipase L1-like esterase